MTAAVLSEAIAPLRDDAAESRLRSLDRTHRLSGFYGRFDGVEVKRARRMVSTIQRAIRGGDAQEIARAGLQLSGRSHA